MTTTAATVHTDYAAAITALQAVFTDVHDATNGILHTEALASGVKGLEREVLAKAAANAKKALAILQDGTVDQLVGSAF